MVNTGLEGQCCHSQMLSHISAIKQLGWLTDLLSLGQRSEDLNGRLLLINIYKSQRTEYYISSANKLFSVVSCSDKEEPAEEAKSIDRACWWFGLCWQQQSRVSINEHIPLSYIGQSGKLTGSIRYSHRDLLYRELTFHTYHYVLPWSCILRRGNNGIASGCESYVPHIMLRCLCLN